ncbi:hypothetical protein AVEN_92042-1 [Araneus ventricosus]|uniref:Uncharacterized protein n=1 Tax=Araneus ventricosus TaxID=182803 RepID=A0A4Y2MRZ5_ARAVE|nr:hypothetical protein AVEN_92042-1 [Araneus ventricosus]
MTKTTLEQAPLSKFPHHTSRRTFGTQKTIPITKKKKSTTISSESDVESMPSDPNVPDSNPNFEDAITYDAEESIICMTLDSDKHPEQRIIVDAQK